MNVSFRKMDGAGNDFVVIDLRGQPLSASALAPHVAALANRANAATGGCDQVIVIAPSQKADVRMHIFNPDGEEVGACGNATRCVGWLVMQQQKHNDTRIEVSDRVLECRAAGDKQVRVDMGAPSFASADLHLLDANADTLSLPISEAGFANPVGVSMGNPHMVFFVPDVASVDVTKNGAKLEVHPLYTQKANVSFAQIMSPSEIKVAVWERGAGITQACGTAACAVAVAAVRRGLCERDVMIHMPGGDLRVEWDAASGHVFMTGPVRDHGEGVVAL